MAIKINLLDWRQERRNRFKQQFLVLLGLGAAGAAALVMCGWLTALTTVGNQTATKANPNQPNADTEKKVKENHDRPQTKASVL